MQKLHKHRQPDRQPGANTRTDRQPPNRQTVRQKHSHLLQNIRHWFWLMFKSWMKHIRWFVYIECLRYRYQYFNILQFKLIFFITFHCQQSHSVICVHHTERSLPSWTEYLHWKYKFIRELFRMFMLYLTNKFNYKCQCDRLRSLLLKIVFKGNPRQR